MNPEQPATSEDRDVAHPDRRRARLRRLLLAGLILAPAAALSVAIYVLLATGPPHCVLDGDGALCELAVRELGFDGPWVGAYSRLGFHHPGPLHYYLLAPTYAVFQQGGGFGLSAATCVLHMLLFGLAVWVVSTVGGRRGMIAAASMAFVSVGYVFIHSAECLAAWEPGISRAAILTTAAGAYAAYAERRLAGLLVATFAASLAIQSHLSVVPPIAIAASIAVVGLAWRRDVAAGGRAANRRAFTWAAVLALTLWIPPIVEQFSSEVGNVSRIVDRIRVGEPSLSFGEGLRLTAFSCTEWSARVFGLESTAWRGVLCMLQVLVSIGLVVFAIRRGRRHILAVAVLSIGLHLAVWIAALRIVGEFSSHLLMFGSTACWPLFALAVAWLAVRPKNVRIALAIALVWLVYVGGRRVGGGMLGPVVDPDSVSTPFLVQGLASLGQRLHELDAVEVVVEDATDGGTLQITAGIVLGLRKAGFRARPGPKNAWAFPRTYEPGPRTTRVQIVPFAGDLVRITPAFGARIIDW